ncbi:hypothetical protein HK102_000989 [Quaeritorhiza haematococci]|nr:hypothetical protein HK102_000989 [Quaeritorhiza haematococci]
MSNATNTTSNTDSDSGATAAAAPACIPTVFYATFTAGNVYLGMAICFSGLAAITATTKWLTRRTHFWMLFSFGALMDFFKNLTMAIYVSNSSFYGGNPWTAAVMYYVSYVCFFLAAHIPMTGRIWRFFLTQINTTSTAAKRLTLFTKALVVALYIANIVLLIATSVYFFRDSLPTLRTTGIFIESTMSSTWIDNVGRVVTSISLILSLFSEVMFVKNFLSKQTLAAVRGKDGVVIQGLALYGLLVLNDLTYALTSWIEFAKPVATAANVVLNPPLFMYGFLIPFLLYVTLSFDFWALQQIIDNTIPHLINRKNTDNNNGGAFLDILSKPELHELHALRVYYDGDPGNSCNKSQLIDRIVHRHVEKGFTTEDLLKRRIITVSILQAYICEDDEDVKQTKEWTQLDFIRKVLQKWGIALKISEEPPNLTTQDKPTGKRAHGENESGPKEPKKLKSDTEPESTVEKLKKLAKIKYIIDRVAEDKNVRKGYLKDFEDLQKKSIDDYKTRLARHQDKAHINVKPVYLGFVAPYKNHRGLIETADLTRKIDNDFKIMTKRNYKFSPLKDFYEPSPDGQGYVRKEIEVKTGKKEKMFDIDHIIPESFGGINHPRNYVAVHRSMNRSWKDALPVWKMAYIQQEMEDMGKSRHDVLSKVGDFSEDILKSRRVQQAIKNCIPRNGGLVGLENI